MQARSSDDETMTSANRVLFGILVVEGINQKVNSVESSESRWSAKYLITSQVTALLEPPIQHRDSIEFLVSGRTPRLLIIRCP
jgi:hypothetical protein